MAISHFHRILEERIERLITERALSVIGGACTSFEAYKQQVGFVEGLQAAISIGRDIEREDS